MMKEIDDDDRIQLRKDSFERQKESIDLLHILSSPNGVPRDELRGITRANLRILGLTFYLQSKGLIDSIECEKYIADYMEWYIDHIANKTDEEYGSYCIDID